MALPAISCLWEVGSRHVAMRNGAWLVMSVPTSAGCVGKGPLWARADADAFVEIEGRKSYV
jgi:hypothetical protein